MLNELSIYTQTNSINLNNEPKKYFEKILKDQPSSTRSNLIAFNSQCSRDYSRITKKYDVIGNLEYNLSQNEKEYNYSSTFLKNQPERVKKDKIGLINAISRLISEINLKLSDMQKDILDITEILERCKNILSDNDVFELERLKRRLQGFPDRLKELQDQLAGLNNKKSVQDKPYFSPVRNPQKTAKPKIQHFQIPPWLVIPLRVAPYVAPFLIPN